EVHEVVGELMYANNFFIALYDEERQLIAWPYYVDELDTDIPDPNQWDAFGERNARGTTAYVLRTGEPQLLTYARWKELIERGERQDPGDLRRPGRRHLDLRRDEWTRELPVPNRARRAAVARAEDPGCRLHPARARDA